MVQFISTPQAEYIVIYQKHQQQVSVKSDKEAERKIDFTKSFDFYA